MKAQSSNLGHLPRGSTHTAPGQVLPGDIPPDTGHWSDEKLVTYRNFADVFASALWQAGHKDFQPAE